MSAPRFLSFFASRRGRWIAGGVLLLMVIVAVVGVRQGWFGESRYRRPNPLVDTPVLVLRDLKAKPLYFNGPAQPWLASQRPDLLMPEVSGANAGNVAAFAQAALEPKIFRALDRQFRFEALLFVGDPTQSRPLLEHLAATKDWSLSYVDQMSMVYRRGAAKTWAAEDFAGLEKNFAQEPAWVRATILAQTALRLVAAHEMEAAKVVLEKAAALDQKAADVWSGWAAYHMQRGEYAEAFQDADRALAIDKKHLPALSTKTHLLYATKQFPEAYDLSQKLLERVPDDPNLLFYHAKIAHEVHAYKAEIEALEKIIAQATAAGRPLSGYQMYLGQAYMAKGDGVRAIEVFTKVLQDPELPADQADFARESIARIRKKMGI